MDSEQSFSRQVLFVGHSIRIPRPVWTRFL